MNSVKIFQADTIEQIEEQMNAWLRERPTFKVIGQTLTSEDDTVTAMLVLKRRN